MKPFLTILFRELRLAAREGGAVGTALGFFVVVVTILPLGLGPDLNLLSRIAPGVLWVALLLAGLLSMGRLFEADLEDGTLEALAHGTLPLEIVAAAKCLAHWISTSLPLVLTTPLLGLLLNLEIKLVGPLVATLLAGTPALSFVGGIGAALTAGARRGGPLLALIVLPLFVPTLIFGISAVSGARIGSSAFLSPLLIVAAFSLAAIVLAPIAMAAALRSRLGA